MDTDLQHNYFHAGKLKPPMPKLILVRKKSDFFRTNHSQSTLDQDTQLRTSATLLEKIPKVQRFLTDRPTQQSKQRIKKGRLRYSMNQNNKFMKINNNHDVFYAPETKNPECLEIEMYKNIYKNSQWSIDYFQKEIGKFEDDNQNQNTKNAMFNLLLDNYLKVSVIQGIAMRVLEKFKHIQKIAKQTNKIENTSKVEQNQCSTKIRTQEIPVRKKKFQHFIGFSILLNYQLAKVIQLMQNPILALQYYKQSKRLSDSEKYYKFKMKSYRHLGELFITIDKDLAQLYLTKFLMAAWKLKDKKRELQGYDLLGKYYYYVGNMDKAIQFHDRMVQGKFEPENSQVRKLAVSKLNNGSLGKQKRYHNQDHDYAVTSDDENYEIIFPRHYLDEQGIKQISIDEVIENLQLSKKQVQKHKLRNEPEFENIELRKTKILYQKANENIKIKREVFNSQIFENNEINLRKLQIAKPNTKLGTCKDKCFLSHLTPNRNLQTYQSIELCKSSKSFLNSHKLNACCPPQQLRKINKVFQKFNSVVGFLTQWVYQAQLNQVQNDKSRQNDSPSRRKGYLIQQ